jgi:hypothetical protein
MRLFNRILLLILECCYTVKCLVVKEIGLKAIDFALYSR